MTAANSAPWKQVAATEPFESSAALDCADQRRAQILLVESANQSSIMTHAGQQESLRFRNAIGRTCSLGLRAEALEGALDGWDIAGAIVNDRYFHSNPLVLGKIFC